MANLQKHRAHESLNTDSAAGWDTQAVLEATGTTATKDVSSYHTMHLQTDNDIYFEFDTTTTDAINTSNSLYLMGGDTIYSLKIPRALGDTIIFQARRKTSTSSTIKIVLA